MKDRIQRSNNPLFKGQKERMREWRKDNAGRSNDIEYSKIDKKHQSTGIGGTMSTPQVKETHPCQITLK